MSFDPEILWRPSKKFAEDSNLRKYQNWLFHQYGLRFKNYDDLWNWSVEYLDLFWKSIWEYFKVKSYTEHHRIFSSDPMPYTRWFDEATLNYAEHIFRNKTDAHPAIIYTSEKAGVQELSWTELESRVSSVAQWLKDQGVTPGDRVAAYLPNIPEATIAFLAVNSIGAVWSSCSPDFGSASVRERFEQIEPKILIAANGYTYNGKPYEKTGAVHTILKHLPTVQKVVWVDFLKSAGMPTGEGSVSWDEVVTHEADTLYFEPLSFNHPIWVVYSSGTTGKPKAITHSHGGALLEHLKYLTFHNDVKPGERFFWYSTTGWMMWNFVQASMLRGATIVLYEGSAGYPDLNRLWKFAEEARINHFGTSAPFIVACMKNNLKPKDEYDFSSMRSLSSTGAPLPPEAFDYVYSNVKKDVWLCSMSGGTDACTAFVGGVPTEPVYRGEIQRRALGCALYAFNDQGEPVTGEVGEMVIAKPMPSMPIYFWDDPDFKRYKESYFEMYDKVWRHGDWVRISSDNTIRIFGRSDATLNRQGVRIGTAEIYRSINKIPEIKDSLIVNLEWSEGRHFMPLFIVLAGERQLTPELKEKVRHVLKENYSPRHVPDEIVEAPDVPYTISGKKMEAPVKKILLGVPVSRAANRGSMRNPGSLDFFIRYQKSLPA